MSVTVFEGIGWGVYKYTQPDGGGTTQPQVLNAYSTGLNSVRLIFDREMNFGFNPLSTGLLAKNYQIERLSDSEELTVLRVTKVSDTAVDLLTIDQTNDTYRVTVLSATDAWDNDIDPANDTYDFTGTAPVYPTLDDVGSFFGFEGGMQHELNANITPDSDPPFLDGLDPASGEPNVSVLSNITLEIKDLGDGVDESTVVITVEGATVWIGDAAQPGYDVAKVPILDGFRYVIDPNTPLPAGEFINVGVYARDLSIFQNLLNTAYSFSTISGAAPRVSNRQPDSNEAQVPLAATISFDLTDDQGDLDASKTVITVDGVTAYSGQLAKNGFAVTRTPITKGYSYVITPPDDFGYGAQVDIGIIAEDYSNYTLLEQYSFFTVEDPNCFTGPLTEFELTLENPLLTTGTRFLEALRLWLLRNLLNVIQQNRAIRSVYLRAYEHPASVILSNLVPTPTSREKDVGLCGRRTNIQVNEDMKQQPQMLERALTELTVLGTPDKHRRMLQAYISTGNPNDRVPIACIMVLLARALEDNELV